jgi:hypothetical protein
MTPAQLAALADEHMRVHREAQRQADTAARLQERGR